jgi:hypothetical protein
MQAGSLISLAVVAAAAVAAAAYKASYIVNGLEGDVVDSIHNTLGHKCLKVEAEPVEPIAW